jgi:hypothetical protein
MEFVLQMFAVTLMPAIVILLPLYWRTRERQRLLETVRTALESGHPVPPQLIEAMARTVSREPSRPTPQRDVRRGSMLVAIALGLALIGLCIFIANSSGEGLAYAMAVTAVGAIPGCVGAAFIILGLRAGSTDAIGG